MFLIDKLNAKMYVEILYNILSVHQFDFQKGLNTTDALAEFGNIVFSSINKD